MLVSEKVRRNELWNEFTKQLPAVVREFNRDIIDVALDQAYDEYLGDRSTGLKEETYE